jgi:octaprenyl-diphosphate synthase
MTFVLPATFARNRSMARAPEPRTVTTPLILRSPHSGVVAAALVLEELESVERRIAEVIRSREATLTMVSDYLINAGGKRVRPAVAMLVFRACGGDDIRDMVDLSVSLELIHTATLLHDDIIDSNDVRRGKDAAPVRFGIADTLVTGDFLFSRAFEVCGRFEPKIVAWAAAACIQLTEGEIMQGRFRRNLSVTFEDYVEIIERKTASLFAAGARIAAYLAGMPDDAVERMDECGREIGLAFQMIDDVLDVGGEAGKIGKRIGTDLFDGNPSLPVLWGLGLPAVSRAFTAQPASPDLVAEALAELRSSGVLERVRECAVMHAERAASLVRGLPQSAYRDALNGMISELVARQV